MPHIAGAALRLRRGRFWSAERSQRVSFRL